MKTIQELKLVLDGMRKVYPYLKSEGAKQRLVTEANRIKGIIARYDNSDEKLYQEAKKLFG